MKKQLIVSLVIATLGYTGLQEKLFAMDPLKDDDFCKTVLQEKTSKEFGLWYLNGTANMKCSLTRKQRKTWNKTVSKTNDQLEKNSERVKYINEKIIQKNKAELKFQNEEEKKKAFFMQRRYRFLQADIKKTQDEISSLQNKLKKETEQIIPTTSGRELDRIKKTLFDISMNEILPLEEKLINLQHEKNLAELKFRRSIGGKRVFNDFIAFIVEKEQWLNAKRNIIKKIENKYQRALYKLYQLYKQKTPRPRSESK